MNGPEKNYDKIFVGCGRSGTNLLLKEPELANVLAFEASPIVGLGNFLPNKLFPSGSFPRPLQNQRNLPPLQIYWEKSFHSPDQMDFLPKDWAFVLPQWKLFFGQLSVVDFSPEDLTTLRPSIKLQNPVGEITFDSEPSTDSRWTVRSGDDVYSANQIVWTLGLKAFQACLGKKTAEAFLVSNPNFLESARDAEGVFSVNYVPSQNFSDEKFIALPVRHNGKLYLSFISIASSRFETFTYLPNDFLEQPKEISSFEKSLRRTIKHILETEIETTGLSEIGLTKLGLGSSLASPWSLDSDPERGLTARTGEDLFLTALSRTSASRPMLQPEEVSVATESSVG